MNAAKLTKYGLVPVAHVRIVDQNLIIDITDQKTVELEMCIYAFLIGGKVYRIGSSKAPLENRLKDYKRDITNALNGRKSPAPPEEAEKWKKILPDGISGDIYARQGTSVTTPIGTFHAYMDEESLMIGEIFTDRDLTPDEILNRNKHR
ncbi:MAG: hypothetical protein ABSG60_12090 [Terracidiphilus sp.]|jgi:deoxyhypusine synthase